MCVGGGRGSDWPRLCDIVSLSFLVFQKCRCVCERERERERAIELQLLYLNCILSCL